MKNPFSSDVPEEKKLVRNVFDLGRSSVFTTEFGQLYPFFLQEVIPGDSVQLDAQVGLRGMPTLFPLQTKMRYSIEFYYVRNRTLYKDWEDFIYKTKDVESPWLKLNTERAHKMISTGSLGDALGVPSSVASDTGFCYQFAFTNPSAVYLGQRGNSSRPEFSTFYKTLDGAVFDSKKTQISIAGNSASIFAHCVALVLSSEFLSEYPTDGVFNFSIDSNVEFPAPDDLEFGVITSDGVFHHVNCEFQTTRHYIEIFTTQASYTDFKPVLLIGTNVFESGSYKISSPLVSDVFTNVNKASIIHFGSASLSRLKQWFYLNTSDVQDATSEFLIEDNPFVGSHPDIKLSALPFRAYEQCMNYYYRNDKNNPYVLDNQVQYNEFIPTHDGGADENVYDFHYRNWELDRFTSAVPSPQFGEAPLVGLTYNPSKGTATLKLEGASVTDAQGVVTQTDPEITVGVDSDGKLDSIIDFSKDVPSANLRKLQEQMQSNTGISINDLRVTNSFQRFLENTMRRGLRYRNQLKSHHHVSVDYPDIDVPQYIGGASGIVDTGQVTNMSQTGNVGLGDYIGTLTGGVGLKHKIQHYCVEHGWIIGIVSVCPLPSYPQSINKSLIKTNPFDYYLPEFGKIGYVPIHYSELMPLQTTGPDQSVDDIFGYQKAWYDYMQAFDEVHGDFRISLKDFVLTRTFAERPQLSESFTVIDPEQLNDVFLANNIATPYGSTARWMCRSNVSCIMKRQIPMIGTPSLE